MEASGPGVFTKRRDAARPGSIPDRLQMFPREVRFYREVAPDVGVRVPGCWRAEDEGGVTFLELEDLSSWQEGAEATAGARTLADLHRLWEGRAVEVWPWLPRPDVSDLVEVLYAERWPRLVTRPDLTPAARDIGERLLGRVREAERSASASGPPTLVHGDATSANMRTSPDGVVALLDWEDYGFDPGVRDLGWFLVSSVGPGEWPDAIEAYGTDAGLTHTLPAAVVQALLSLSSEDEGSDHAVGWIRGIEEAARRLSLSAG